MWRQYRAGILKANHHRIDSLGIYRGVPGDWSGLKAWNSSVVLRVEDGYYPNLS